MSFIGLLIDQQYSAGACGRSSAELHVTLAHIPEKNDSIPGPLLLDLDMLFSYTRPQALALGDVERFGSILVRRAAGVGLRELKTKVTELLDLHCVKYSRDYEPWVPHCSIGIDLSGWSWTYRPGSPYIAQNFAVHASRVCFAGLLGVVAHHWNLGTALRPSVPPATLVEG